MLGTLSDKPASWLAGTGPEAAVAVCSHVSLVRNLADFPFPNACTEDEKRSIEERVTGALEGANLLASGQYRSLSEPDARDALLLAERRLIPFDGMSARGRHGVYVSDDQSLSIAVNGANHLCLTVIGSGLQFQELWSRLNLLDNMLGQTLDFAFDDRLGYLTSSLGHVGTGLKASVILHLPALSMANRVKGLAEAAKQNHHGFYGLKSTLGGAELAELLANEAEDRPARSPASAGPHVGEAFYFDLNEAQYGEVSEAQGDLYLLANQATLGYSEEEILFHLRHTGRDIVGQEKRAREVLAATEHRRLEDRVGRALGVARNAHLLGFTEAVCLLSSIRLGVDTGLLKGYSVERLNELLFASQSAHISAKVGRDCDEWMLNMERADLFRARFSQSRKDS